MNPNIKHKQVEIIHKDEPQTVIKLEDGTTIKMQIVVFGVLATFNEDGSRCINEDGSPMYGVNSEVVLFVDTFERIPDNVKRN